MPESPSGPDAVALSLRISRAADPIRGELSSAGGAVWPFEGWLELAAAIDAACAMSAPRPTHHETGGVT
ncbi:MAG TPA: hypothetical protein VHB69_01470 [Mycobacteriales bacterium]|nr:hypothetical protein [Mycobacteriales bacterium]